MLVLLFFLAIVLVTLIYFFFAPFYLEIDSTMDLYKLRFHRLASARFKIENNSLTLEVKIGWWKKSYDLLAGSYQKTKNPFQIERKKEKLKWKKIKAVLSSFKISKCSVVLDTGDMQVNGILYPVFFLMKSYSGKNIRISFSGENEVILTIKNNLARMSWAYLSA